LNKRSSFFFLLALSLTVRGAYAGDEVSDDLRSASGEHLEKVKEKSLEYVPGLVGSLPLARGYKNLVQDQAIAQMDDLFAGLTVTVDEKINKLESKIQDILAEEMTMIPKDIGQDFFASYVGFSAGRQTGPWDHEPVREAYLRGHLIGGFLGFGRFFASNFYLGSETFADFSTGEFYPDNTYKYQNHWDAGFAILPGYQLYHGFIYGRTGIIAGRVSRTSDNHDGFDFDTTQLGYQFGLGYNFYVTNRWHMRVDYSYLRFLNVTAQDPNNADITKSYKPAVNHYTVGAVYYLDSLNLDKIDAPVFRTNTFFGGFYMDIPNHFRDDSTDYIPGVEVVEEEKSAVDGFLGGVTLGYLYQFGDSRWVMGAEGYVTLTNRDFEESNDEQAKWNNTFGSGAALTGGYLVKGSNLFYGRMGAGAGTFESKEDKTITMSKMSYQYGGGAETMITKRFAIRVE